MKNETTVIEGAFFDGLTPLPVPGVLSISLAEVTLSYGATINVYQLASVQVSPRIGAADRFVMFPHGGQLLCSDHPCLDHLRNESWIEKHVAWLERRVAVSVASVLLIFALGFMTYHSAVPVIASWATNKISFETERTLGIQAVEWLDKENRFQKSEVDEWRIARAEKILAKLVKGLKQEPYYRLELRHSERIGPNAMALPGGVILVTDEMIWVVETEDELAAVLAHEIGHVELRHGLKEVMENSAVAMLAGVVMSDASSFTAAVNDLPLLLAKTKYSRKAETEADEFCFKLLRQRGISPAAFASIMERLSKDHEAENTNFSFLGTHPVIKERIRRAHLAAKVCMPPPSSSPSPSSQK